MDSQHNIYEYISSYVQRIWKDKDLRFSRQEEVTREARASNFCSNVFDKDR